MFTKANLKPLWVAIFPQVFMLQCANQEAGNIENGDQNLPAGSAKVTENDISSPNVLWTKYLNQRSDSLQFLYKPEAIKITAEGEIVEGKTNIGKHWLNQSLTVKSLHSDTLLLASKQRGLAYEIGTFMDTAGNVYKQLVIWENHDADRSRVFELIEAAGMANSLPSGITTRRALWMDLCNEHNVEGLVNELYTEDALYFNHKPLVKGRTALIREYQYMKNENYHLTLNPIIVEKVNEETVYEIGQCEGSYGGKYILIWKLGVDGNWRIWIDSNI